MEIKEGYYYTQEHEWIKVDGNKGKVGISDYAQHKLGDITYIEPCDEGKELKQGDVLTGVESVKAASDVYSPVSGKVINFNESLDEAPELVNKEPYDGGWLAEIEILNSDELSSLMDFKSYQEYVGGLE